ncbi:MAG: hypothetical protein OEW15_07670 [Nitrospirota bacterium]|nr:hypothetical protein [Nitrospirota bacterium]
MKTFVRSTVVLFFAGVSLAAAFAIAAPNAAKQALMGSWNLTERSIDAQGQPCPFVPENIEFFGDQTLTMSNMPGNRLQFKTNVTADERTAIEARMPGLKSKSLLLIRPMPQMEWKNTPIAYGYSLSKKKDILTLLVPGWSPAKFQRVKK